MTWREKLPRARVVKGGKVGHAKQPTKRKTRTATASQLDPCFIDLYEGDVNGKPYLNNFGEAGEPWHGVILKATEGTYYSGNTSGWLTRYWKMARTCWGTGYGTTAFRGAYLYLRCDERGKPQGDFFLQQIDKAGGWGTGDLWPIIDVESGEQPAGLSNQQIIDVISECAHTISTALGRMVMRYSGSYLLNRGIKGKFGCDLLWVADWAATLDPNHYIGQGYTLKDTPLWQYCGDGTSFLRGYPRTAPVGPLGQQWPVDISAGIINGGWNPKSVLQWIAANLQTPPSHQRMVGLCDGETPA